MRDDIRDTNQGRYEHDMHIHVQSKEAVKLARYSGNGPINSQEL